MGRTYPVPVPVDIGHERRALPTPTMPVGPFEPPVDPI